MSGTRKWSPILGIVVGVFAGGVAPAQERWETPRRNSSGSYVPPPVLASSVDPHLYGVDDYTITVISGAQFNSSDSAVCSGIGDIPTLSNVCACTGCTAGFHTWASLDIPAGAIIDFVGVNNATTVDASMGFSLLFRDHLGGSAPLVSFSFPAHDGGGFVTDWAGPLGILIPGNHDRSFILDIERAPVDGLLTFLGYVEIWWRRTVSDPPATPTFGDVPNGHPFYQFVEALGAAGITGGCGNGNFCPDAPLTRGQMAVFLAKALGLHWPN